MYNVTRIECALAQKVGQLLSVVLCGAFLKPLVVIGNNEDMHVTYVHIHVYT